MQRPPIATRPASAADRPTAAAILAKAFIDDPALSYLFTDAADRPRRLARFFALITSIGCQSRFVDAGGRRQRRRIGRRAVAAAGAVEDAGRRDPAHTPCRWCTVFGWLLRRALAMQGRIESHHPHPPHWYLQFVGCVPERHGRGQGGAVIRARLAQCDADGVPAALETATPANVGIYEALGFVVTGNYRIKGGGPEFWSMWREPR